MVGARPGSLPDDHLGITDAQMQQVKQAAGALPTLWRDAFLQAVAHFEQVDPVLWQ